MSYAYDPSGRVQDVAWKIHGAEGPFVLSRVYDGLGRLQAVRYPDVAGIGRTRIEYSYNP